MKRRTGLTLVEVLVAIFIMGIGLIALLTLFPIGILRMAQAIRDEKAAQAAGIAHANAILYNFRNDPFVVSALGEPDLFANPNAAGGFLSSDPFGESYAIYVDPIGFYSFTGAPQKWVGGTQGFLRRQPVSGSVVPDLASTIRTFKLWDDITFDSTFDPSLSGQRPGTPKVIAPLPPSLVLPTIQRDPVYSWAYLLRRPQTQDRSVVDCAIVVYDKRATIIMGETVFDTQQAYFDPAKNTILLDITGPGAFAPNLRAGDWLFDTTGYTNGVNRSAHSYFYRIVAAEDVPGAGTAAGRVYAKYEVQTPIRGFISAPSKISSIGIGSLGEVQDPTRDGAIDPNKVYKGTIIVMDRVAEVFEKGPVRLP